MIMEFYWKFIDQQVYLILSFSSFRYFSSLSFPSLFFKLFFIVFFFFARFHSLLGEVHRSSTVLNFWQDCWKFNAISDRPPRRFIYRSPSSVTFSRNKTTLKK